MAEQRRRPGLWNADAASDTCRVSHHEGAGYQAKSVACVTAMRFPSGDPIHMSLPRFGVSRSGSRQASYEIKNKASMLANLADAISSKWDEMDDVARLGMVRKIHLLAVELGRVAEPPGLRSTTANSGEGSPWFDGLIFLTPREHEVLRALSLGASTKRITELFGISTSTVRGHVKSILAKLGVHSRVEAVSVLLTFDARQNQSA
jgi:DNA-binding CsgD family transcriptional regulator